MHILGVSGLGTKIVERVPVAPAKLPHLDLVLVVQNKEHLNTMRPVVCNQVVLVQVLARIPHDVVDMPLALPHAVNVLP